MKTQTQQPVHSRARAIRGLAAIAVTAIITTLTMPAAHAGLFDAVKTKVTKARAKVSERIVGGIGDRQVMGAIIDSARPVIDLVLERKREYDAFDAEAFRDELLAAVDNIANMQTMLVGRVGPGISRLQDKLISAHPMVLFALSETPLTELLDKTEGMAPELQTLVRITTDAIHHLEASTPADRLRQLSALGMSAAAPAYVSCKFVLDNIFEEDIDMLNLLRLRVKQMSGVAKIALLVLPKSQTIGVNVVGGATVSIPNPLTPMIAGLKKAADEYYELSENWTEKFDACQQEQLNERLSDFLAAQGY